MISTPTQRHRRTALLLATASLTIAACTGDDDGASSTSATTAVPSTTTETTEALPPTTTAPTTLAPPSTSTVAPDTTTARTTDPETTAPPTVASDVTATTDPPTFTGPDNPDAQAMLAALDAYNAAMVALAADPSNDDRLRAALALTTDLDGIGDGSGYVERYAEVLNRDQLVIRQNTDLPSRDEIFEGSITITADSGSVTICRIDGNIVVATGGADGVETIVDDGIESRVISFSFQRVDGQWLVSDRDTLSRFEDQVAGQEGCA